jgi:hypothetical protein
MCSLGGMNKIFMNYCEKRKKVLIAPKVDQINRVLYELCRFEFRGPHVIFSEDSSLLRYDADCWASGS